MYTQPFATITSKDVKVVTVAMIATLAMAVALTPQHHHQHPSHPTHDTHMHQPIGTNNGELHQHHTAAPSTNEMHQDHMTHNNQHMMDMNGAHSDHSMSMPMFFTLRMSGQLLFSFIDVTSSSGYLFFALLLSLACVLREYLHVYRLELEKDNADTQLFHTIASQQGVMHSDDGTIRIESHRKCCGLITLPVLSSTLYALNMCLAYLIMLVVMSYDFTYFFLILVSSGVSHYYFQHLSPRRRAESASSRTPSPSASMRNPYSSHHRRHESHTDEEVEQLAPMIHDTKRHGSGGSTAATKKAAMQLHITKDCCES